MRRIGIGLLLSVLAGGWFVSKNYNFEHDGFERFTLVRKTSMATEVNQANLAAPPVERDGNTIRIASFNIQVFGTSKAGKAPVMAVLADVVRRFDVVAIQEIRTTDMNLLPEFVRQINSTGRKYDYVIGPRLGRTSSKEQYAFVFDTASVEADSAAMYTVVDPDDLLHREPLVCPFRVRGPPPGEAFTFTLINIHTDPDETDTELDFLDDVYEAVRRDGRNEDDVILLGDLNVDDQHLGQLGMVPGIAWMISSPAKTNTRGSKLYDNIVYTPQATTEFTGRAGVFNLMSVFHLTESQALEVSDHFPIWAEFTVRENGVQSSIATRPDGVRRQ